MINIESIQQILAEFPNANISITPTPIYKMSRLSARLGSNIYIMREDLTGFAIGGNKNRKLDYLIGDALRKNADTLITMKASSFSRNAAAAGKVFGFEVHVILAGTESEQNTHSQALFRQFETVLHYAQSESPEAIAVKYEDIINDLRDRNRVVYQLHPGGSDTIGALGYINAFDQIVQYTGKTGIHFDKIVHSTGSTATQVGLLLGQSISAYNATIIGMAASQKAGAQRERVRELAETTADLLKVSFDDSEIVVDDRFIGPGYAIESEEGRNAAKLFAVLEGVLLDSVYTGKAAAGLIQYAANGELGNNENVLFIHTGGNSDLFY
jgi:1-aminocyclopropane-1-carboxylate deaminase/D-cysteine desulfhydrase-like pyridoxal-dependent ACC family enzyme